MIEQFFKAMSLHVPTNAQIMSCQFRGDPGEEFRGKWRARVVDDLRSVDRGANVYFAVSAMKPNARGQYRRRKENFAAGLLLMIDDLGTGPGAKFPLEIIDPLPPTCLVETSPENYQAIYLFDRPVTEISLFERLIKQFIHKEFIGNDPGMNGVNRVFRPPVGVNGKRKYGGYWIVKAHEEHYARRFSPEAIAAAYELDLTPRVSIPRGATTNRAASIRAFVAVRSGLELRGEREDGWTDIQCPWVAGHTGGLDNGAGIREPAEENGWTGAFRCHHGSCAERGWRDLTEWLAADAADILSDINKRAGAYGQYQLSK